MSSGSAIGSGAAPTDHRSAKPSVSSGEAVGERCSGTSGGVRRMCGGGERSTSAGISSPVASPSSSNSNSLLLGRLRASLSRQAATSVRSRPSSSPSSGGAVRMRCSTGATESCPNGAVALAAKHIVAPHENTSAAPVTAEAVICSGAMYAGVPTPRPLTVAAASSALARPKSMTRGPSDPSSTFCGLKSLCTMPARWMAVSAVAVLTASRSSAPPRLGPVSATSRCSEGPSTYSLTMYGRP